MFRILFLLIFISTLLIAKISYAQEVRPSLQYSTVQKFIKKMVDKHQFSQHDLEQIFSEIHFKVWQKGQISPKKLPKRKPPNWQYYQKIFLTNARIENGLKFWQKYTNALKRAEVQFDVPAQIIVAILGIETNYGRNKGKYPTLATLAKKAFNGYRRAKFYQSELEHFLLLTRANGLTPLAIFGSHAGAMGYAQFIASSYRHYAIDFDKDGKIDLFNNPIDAIGSIANYFAKHHWQKNMPIAYALKADESYQKFAHQQPVRPKTLLKTWRSRQIDVPINVKPELKAEIIRLNYDHYAQYWLTLDNFYILTRYNHSNLYAMAVYQLSKILETRIKKEEQT